MKVRDVARELRRPVRAWVIASEDIGRRTLFDPTVQRADVIEHGYAIAATAMAHAWDHEQAIEIERLLRPPHDAFGHVVIIDIFPKSAHAVFPAVLRKQLAAVRLELSEVGIDG